MTIDATRSSVWETDIEGSLRFKDLIGIGLSFEEIFTQEITERTTIKYPIPSINATKRPAEERFNIGWTAILLCDEGVSRQSDGEHRYL